MIAANATLGLMEPVSNGVGGDLFAIVLGSQNSHKLYGYNGSGRAATRRSLSQMIGKVKAVAQRTGKPYVAHIPPLGSLPITVPGTVDAWFALHDKFGKLPIADDLAPAITYARHRLSGFASSGALLEIQFLRHSAENAAMIEELDNARATYLIDGHTPAEGEVFRRPRSGQYALQRIAKGGRDEFYKGDITKTIDVYFKRIGGDLRYEDFAKHHGEWVRAAFGELSRL